MIFNTALACLRHTVICLAAMVIACSAAAAESPQFPTKPVRFIVPTLPGGGVDIIARMVGQKLSENWGQTVVVENRAGATGNIGVEAVARAQADGYTLLVSTNAMLTINPHLYDKVGYDPLKDFAPITLAASSPFLLVVHPKVGVNSVKELIAYAKAHPGTLNYSSSGNGSATHLAGVLFASMAGINIVHVPYKGSSAAITDLLGGQIQMRFSAALPVIQFIRGGRLKALGISTLKRSPQFPDIPAVAETLPGYQSDIWYGFSAPAKTPPALVNKINADIVRILDSKEVKDKLLADGSDVIANSPAAFTTQIRTEFRRWAKVVKEAGVKGD